jgi:transposase
MIAFAPGARVWLAGGVTDMRRGMPGLAPMAQEGLRRDPRAGDVFVFRGRNPRDPWRPAAAGRLTPEVGLDYPP